MKRTGLLFVFLAGRIAFAQLPPVVPIVTPEELRLAVADVPVAKIDFILPERPEDAETSLAKRFFNQPSERRYAGVTSEHWKEKWTLFSTSLIAKAKQAGLAANSLEQALSSLNKGRNLQTASWPPIPVTVDKIGLTAEQEKAEEMLRQKAEEKYHQALKQREKNPEPYYRDDLAIIPVGAYLAKHAKGECWLIVCKWEYVYGEESTALGHIMIWAMDVKTGSVLAYVTCD